MAKGKKATKRLPESTIGAEADLFAAQPPAEVQEESGSLVCSQCGTLLDRSKADERKCWLCGQRGFINPTEVELQRQKKRAEKKEFCCPNPKCERPPELVRNSEKYCGGCGSTLEQATLGVWFRKCVEPEVTEDPSRLVSGWGEFIDAAWRLQLTKEEAEAKLDEYRTANDFERRTGTAPQVASVDAAARANDPAGSTGDRQEPSARVEDTRRVTAGGRSFYSPWHWEKYRRQKALRIKSSVIIACFLIVAVFILFFGRGVPVKESNENGTLPPPPPAATPTPLSTPTPPPMVEVSDGEFMMGRDAFEGGDRYESPSHPVTVRPFLMDVYEVTREEYQRCVEAAKCATPSAWDGDSYPAGTGRLPVTGVTWEDANNYALWVGKSLPTEEQWEFAARGSDGRLYPWGREWLSGQANIGSNQLTEVGRYKGASPFGLFDMIGNAQEWTRSEWKKYPDKVTHLRSGAASESLRVIRGGSYLDAARRVTATYRNALRINTEKSYAQTGFRCVREAERQ